MGTLFCEKVEKRKEIIKVRLKNELFLPITTKFFIEGKKT